MIYFQFSLLVHDINKKFWQRQKKETHLHSVSKSCSLWSEMFLFLALSYSIFHCLWCQRKRKTGYSCAWGHSDEARPSHISCISPKKKTSAPVETIEQPLLALTVPHCSRFKSAVPIGNLQINYHTTPDSHSFV